MYTWDGRYIEPDDAPEDWPKRLRCRDCGRFMSSTIHSVERRDPYGDVYEFAFWACAGCLATHDIDHYQPWELKA